jgi:hypothetical protein
MKLESAPDLHLQRQERIVKGLMKQDLRHLATAWLTIVTLVAAPTIATGRFVCLKGMPQAGASCPRCHGHQAAPVNTCCKWMEQAPTAGVHTAGPTLTPPTLLAAISIAEPIAQTLALAISSTSANASPPGSSPPQTTILRL